MGLTPNMNLPFSIVNIDSGLTWEENLNAALGATNTLGNAASNIDGHNHAPGAGVQINPDGININSDLVFNTNFATQVGAIGLSAQSAPLASSYTGYLYESGVDLYFNDGNGNQIRITNSGAVAGASGTITGLPSGTASAAYSSANGTFVFQQATATGANIDVASVIIRYPGSYPIPAGNYIILEAPSSLATGYALTLPANLATSSGAFLTSSSSGIISYTNVDNSTLSISSSILSVQDHGLSVVKSAIRNVTTDGSDPGAGGISTYPINGVTQSTTYTQLGQCILTTTGGSASISFQGSPGDNQSGLSFTASNLSYTGSLAIYRDGTLLVSYGLQSNATGGITYPPGSLNYLDPSPAAGTHTYALYGKVSNSTAEVNFVNNVMVLKEVS